MVYTTIINWVLKARTGFNVKIVLLAQALVQVTQSLRSQWLQRQLAGLWLRKIGSKNGNEESCPSQHRNLKANMSTNFRRALLN